MRIAIITLGCRTNQAESAGMAELLRRRGHEVVAVGEPVDAIIINTCTVTSTADKKSRNAIRRLRNTYPNAILAVCGCLPQTERLDSIDGIDLIGGTSDRTGFIDALELMLSKEERGRGTLSLTQSSPDEPCGWEPLPDARPLGRSRAYIRIQDGCDNHCAYCKVPQARGSSRSRPAESILKAAGEAAADGAIEIVLTGIEISSYQPSLAQLTAEVCLAAEPVKVRVSSLHPNIINNTFTGTLRGIKNFNPTFHLSLQSCCDKTLAAMGRRYTVAEIFSAFELLRSAWANTVITADIIVGFPGENDADYENTFHNLLKLTPNGLHIFPYSRRAGTPAASLPQQLTRAEKAARAKRLAEAFPKVE